MATGKKLSQLSPTTAALVPEAAFIPIVDPLETNLDLRNKTLPIPELRKLINTNTFTTLSTSVWDGSNKKITLTSNTALTLQSNLTAGVLQVEQGTVGNCTLSINGTVMNINMAPGSVTSIGQYFQGTGNYLVTDKAVVKAGTANTGGEETPVTTTPAAPTIQANDTNNTLLFTHALGNSEIEVSINNGSYGAQPSQGYSIGDVNLAAGYYKARTKAATNRNVSAIASSPAFNASIVINVTPVAPTVTADDTANTLSFSHSLGSSEIVVSENNGAFAPYAGTIDVGNNVRAIGYWKAKIKAATGRDESSVTNSPAFALTAPAQTYDSSAQAFFDIAGITNTTHKNTLNTFMLGLKANAGIMTQLKDILIFVKGSVTDKVFNFLNPVDSDDAFRATIGSEVNWQPTWMQGVAHPNGNATGVLQTKLKPKPTILNNDFPNAGWTLGAYVIEGNGTLIGVFDFVGQEQSLQVIGTTATGHWGQNVDPTDATMPSAKGFVVCDTPGALEDANKHYLRFNGNIIATGENDLQIDGSSVLDFYAFAMNYTGIGALASNNSKLGMIVIGNELTGAQHATLSTLVNDMATSFGWNA